jgi:hypothetical protein
MKDFFTWDDLTRDLAIVVAVMFVMYISANITPINIDTITSGTAIADLSLFLQGKTASMTSIQAFFLGLEGLLAVLAIVFFAGIIWIGLRTGDIHHKIRDQYAPIPVLEVEAKGIMVQWQIVLDHINSENPAEWKLAILEADNMLDEILEDQGYLGETVADKLKEMSPLRVASYDDLWDAHKVRNQIAHGGAIDMELSKKTARDTVTKFGRGFKDLGYL